MRIPTRQECYYIMYKMKMMDHIVAHSLQVCRVATFLADSLEADLNPDLVQAAALLHDITKTRSIETHEDHAQTGKQFLISLGYPRVGDIVGQHVLLDEYFASDSPTEADVVNYADKRVVHDKVATRIYPDALGENKNPGGTPVSFLFFFSRRYGKSPRA
ncbi:MAG: HDIG domain-containing protein [Deltaproteobacteria bacterium]|nr:HDIG domain-containing protein [Deltaproteobacteria bacterium]